MFPCFVEALPQIVIPTGVASLPGHVAEGSWLDFTFIALNGLPRGFAATISGLGRFEFPGS